jgi:hypothetical protein
MDSFVIKRKRDNKMQNVIASANKKANLSTGSTVASAFGTKKCYHLKFDFISITFHRV